MKIQFLLYFLLLFSKFTFGQDTIFLDAEYLKTKSKNLATIYKVIKYDKNSKSDTVRYYTKAGQLYIQRTYSNYEEGIRNGKSKEWYESGQLKIEEDYLNGKIIGKRKRWYESGELMSENQYVDGKLNGKAIEWFKSGGLQSEIDYEDDKFNGKVLTYWKNGKNKRIDIYEKDKLIEGVCYDSNGVETKYCNYFIEPKYPGGNQKLMRYLIKNIKYPRNCVNKYIEGKVIVRFVVLKDGSVSEARIWKSVHEELDKEALRVVKKMRKWKPGYIDCELDKVFYNLPIVFKL